MVLPILCRMLATGGDILMNMTATDLDLLEQYAVQHSDSAFTELVCRHLNLVHSAALRQVRSPQLAEEVAQSVFTDLARQAGKLRPGTILSAWLYQVTRRTAVDVVRREARRQLREQIAVELHTMNATADDWTHVEPLLDEAMDALDATDRAAVLLRYFQNQSLREVGQALGTSDDAAQKRVSRAVERLRDFFAKRGVVVGAGALAVLLSANAIQAAPAGLAAAVSAAALTAAASSAGSLLGLLKLTAMTKFKAALIGALVAGVVATPLVIQQQARLGRENRSLRQQLAQLQADNEGLAGQLAQLKRAPVASLPGPPVVVSAATNALAAPSPYDQVTEFIDAHRELPREQIEAYLQQNHHNVESLLAAYQVSRDPAYLREAATNAPNDPAVQFAVIANNIFPNEQRKWIDAFKASSPQNALPWYFSASDYFKSKQPEQAVQELAQATRRPLYGDYSAQTSQAVEEMYNLAGWPPLAAKAWAPGTAASSVSYLNVLKSLANETVQAQQQYLSQGDANSANTMASMGIVLGDQLRRAPSPIDQLVGIAAEKKILAQLDPTQNYDFLGRPVSQAQAELDRQKLNIRDLIQNRDQVRPTLTETELNNYWEREKLYGEAYAMQWLQSKFRQQ